MNNKQGARYYFVQDVMALLGIKQSKAYSVIRCLNAELKKLGYITIDGRIPAKFFDEKYYC